MVTYFQLYIIKFIENYRKIDLTMNDSINGI